MRILVPLDDSLQAHRVLPYVKLLALRAHGAVKLIRATDVEDVTSFNSVEQNALRLREDGVAVEWSVVTGVDAPTAIRQTEIAWRPDLIALASTLSSGLDRWLNGSVVEQVVKSAHTPILLVPPGWERPITEPDGARILVALDGSQSAEQALWTVVRLASMLPAQIVLLRSVDAASEKQGADMYLSQLAARAQPAVADCQVRWLTVEAPAADAILQTARDLNVDVIAMTAEPIHAGGTTTTHVFDRAPLPLILLGPSAIAHAHTAVITLGATVRGADRERSGEVHRVVIDHQQQALIGIVVLGRGRLGHDVLVPLDFIGQVEDGGVDLRVRHAALEQFPDFAYKEFDTPASTWGLPGVPPTGERKRLGREQIDVTRGTAVLATDGEVGHVESVEADLVTGKLLAFWVHGDGLFTRALRVPSDWMYETGEDGTLQLAVTRAMLNGYLGDESHRPRLSWSPAWRTASNAGRLDEPCHGNWPQQWDAL